MAFGVEKQDWQKTRLEYLKDKAREYNLKANQSYDRSVATQAVDNGNWFAKHLRLWLRRYRTDWDTIKKLEEDYDIGAYSPFIYNVSLEYRKVIREAILSGWPVPDKILEAEGLAEYKDCCKPKKPRLRRLLPWESEHD